MVGTREPVLHPIPILSLRPTQMTVGMREVEEKRRRWRAQESNKKRAESLGQRMIPVVRGPNQHHYVVDHHHLARALHDEGVKDVLVTVIADLSMVDRDAFWVVMDNRRWVYPYNSKGERCHFKDIPKSVAPISRTTRSAVSPVNYDAWVALPRIRRRSANFFGPIFCAAGCREKRSRPISRSRSSKGWAWPRAGTQSTCRAGAGRLGKRALNSSPTETSGQPSQAKPATWRFIGGSGAGQEGLLTYPSRIMHGVSRRIVK